jgi:outer membrane receptor protein involved in Fe transport
MVGEFVWPVRTDDEVYFRFEWTFRDESFSTIEDVTYLQSSNAFVLADTTLPPTGGNVLAQVPDRSDAFPFLAPSHHVWNFRAGYNLNQSWEFNVFIENAFDENYFTGAGDNFGLSGFRLRPSWRSFGAMVTYNFGQ